MPPSPLFTNLAPTNPSGFSYSPASCNSWCINHTFWHWSYEVLVLLSGFFLYLSHGPISLLPTSSVTTGMYHNILGSNFYICKVIELDKKITNIPSSSNILHSTSFPVATFFKISPSSEMICSKGLLNANIFQVLFQFRYSIFSSPSQLWHSIIL